ncbi:MAG TPA: hypothetical protein PLJ60_00860 [Chryseolinea sp.]|nr:hypothetical protein [Chryseolinea sp.]
MDEVVTGIKNKIRSFRRKYYFNLFVRGSILTLAILFSYFLLATLVEHNLWLSPSIRFFILFLFLIVIGWSLFRFLKEPLIWWLSKRGLTEEESAKIIGAALPSVNDRLLNLIQLSSSRNKSSLSFASIEQKSSEFKTISFDSIININYNKKYLKYLLFPAVVILALLFINKNVITKSTERLVHFNRQYSPPAPFNFVIHNETLIAFYNEAFPVNLTLKGEAMPQDVYLLIGNLRLKMLSANNNSFQYIFENIQDGFDFQLEAAGFYSDVYHVTMANRPELTGLEIALDFPPYLNKKNEALRNTGNIEIPEGTIVAWKLNTRDAENVKFQLSSDPGLKEFLNSGNQFFTFKNSFRNSDNYEIILENDKSKNKEKITYRIDVIKDLFPQINISNLKDSVLYKRVMLGGNIVDDYGLSQLVLHFRIRDENQKEVSSGSANIPFNKNQLQQNFFYNWSLDSLKLDAGNQLEYYLQVWDNDGVNGRKFTKTSIYTFLVPTKDNLVSEINKTQTQAQQKLDKSTSKANKLQDQIEQASQKIKGKQNLDWQDKKMLEDIVQQKESLNQMIEELKAQNKLLEEKKEAFTERDERIRQKAEQVQKLMNELLDDETKKLFEELQKLLNENKDASQIQKLLDKLNQNTSNLEKELERMLELYKELQYESKFDQAVQDIKKEIDDQKALLEKTESLEKEKSSDDKKNNNNKSNKGDQKNNNSGEEEKKESQELAKEQEKVKEDFQKTAEKIDELKKLGEELEKNDELPGKEETDDIQQNQNESQEQLNQNSPSKSKQAQQKSLQKMQKMQEQMEGSQNSMQMQIDMENLEMLRQIIHGLVKISYDQEGLIKLFGDLAQSDPRFNTLAQLQIKLKDDTKVLEDSLLALSKKDVFMGSIITKEVGELNTHIDNAISANKERRRPQASNEMQLSMTSINNLALLLDDHFDMMMKMMANAKPSSKGNKKGQKPSLSQIQKSLNQKIEDLRKGGRSGRELSEELAEMAAEQERIRKAFQEMQNKMKDGKMPGGDLPSKMEQTEMDLVNKQITDQLIKRQEDILTRMLETEKSQREQDQDEERKGETAKDYDNEIPKAFEEYLRLKEKELELLKTVPPKLYPYYKKEVSEYFKRIGNQ